MALHRSRCLRTDLCQHGRQGSKSRKATHHTTGWILHRAELHEKHAAHEILVHPEDSMTSTHTVFDWVVDCSIIEPATQSGIGVASYKRGPLHIWDWPARE